MTPNDKNKTPAQLRIAAEAQLANKPPPKEPLNSNDELLYKLNVHQVELEMQNEFLQTTQLALQESLDRYADLFEFAPVSYLTLTADGKIVEVNMTAITLLRRERIKLLQKSFYTLVAAEDQSRWLKYFLAIKENIGKSSIELSILRGDGTIFPAQLDCFGTRSETRIAFADITQQKLIEKQRIESEAKQRDLLVREVHHNIKNSLQGVTGILRQFAEKYPNLAEPLGQAIGQIQTIAVVHGLQGRVASTTVRLCELTSAIAANNQSLWQSPMVVSIPPHWIPCRIAEAEAVPLALVLNELIINAVKHGDQSVGVKIKLRHEPQPDMIQVSITNPGQLPANFDFHTQTGIGTGLQLVASLLPRSGADLAWEQREDNVCVRLQLAPPIITQEKEEI
ncbi:MAG: PAS domain-containing protein [Methylophilaceae bacterium]|nr:PAS domain-containing protein [Methylophilaceae bacterium]